jgi:predicted lysophospholipase L1 biosynthesis ABC-type transport system permease subunit
VTTGLRLALEPGRGDRAVPLRSAFVAGAFAVAGVTAVAVFAGSLSHLASTPSLYGDRFQFKTETPTAVQCNRADSGVGEVPGVASLEALCYENVQVDGRANVGFADEPLRGSIGAEVVDGTAPRTKTEVALGASTLATLHKHIGGTVNVGGPGGHGTFRIVGQVVFPVLGDPQPVADGAWLTQSALDTLTGPPGTPGSQDFSRFLVGTYTPGANRAAVDARIARLVRDPSAFFPAVVSGPQLPVEVSRLRQTNWVPIALAVLLAFLALVAIGHALVVGTRRRCRELAILKTLGFERRQIRYAIAWEASLFALASLVVGIPVGLVLGAALWRSVADGVGVTNTPAMPIAFFLAVLVVAAFLLLNAVAFLPARSASRLRPALALRSE